MNGDTEQIMKDNPKGEGLVFGASMRSWLTLTIVWTSCLLSVMEIQVREPLYGALLLTLGFYFGQQKPQTPKL